MESLVINMLRLLCPYLIAMAKKTGTPIDDMVVRIICGLVIPQNTQPK